MAPAESPTKPPNTDRAADPEPTRASAESSSSVELSPTAAAQAPASAANPEEELAIPAAVGKLLLLVTSKRSAAFR